MTENNTSNSTPEYEDEIDLIELVKPLWQQKTLIAGITFITIAVAVIMVLQATPKYKIYVQAKPGVCRWDSKDNPVPYLKTSDLKNILTGGIFDTYTTQIGLKDTAPKIAVSDHR
ncbi:MAG: hypothetical protein DRH03_11270, partial [Deltaproteobacteria bacterium]